MITDPDLTPVSAAQNDPDLTPVGPSSDPDLQPISPSLVDTASAATEAAGRTLGLGITPTELVTASTTPTRPLQAIKEGVQSLAPTEEQILSEAEKTGQTPVGKIAGRVAADTAASMVPTTIGDLAMVAAFPELKAALVRRFPILGRELGSLFSKLPEAAPVPTVPVESPPVEAAPPVPPEPQSIPAIPETPSPVADAATRTSMAQDALSKVAPAEEPFQSGVSEKAVGSLVDQVKTLKDSPIATDTSKRAFQRIMDLIQTGEISETQLADVAQKNGIAPVDLAAMVGEEFSKSGRMLNKASQMVRALNAAFEGNLEAQAALGKVQPPEPTAWQIIADKIRTAESFRRRMLVTQLATTARNVSSQATRFVLQGIDDALTGTVQAITGTAKPKQAFANALEDIMAVGRAMTQGQRRTSLKILDQFPTEAARLLGTPVGDVSLTGKAVDLLNAANTAQEFFFRRLLIDARITGYLRGQGVDVGIGADLTKLPKIPEAKIQQFVGDALEATFAKTPGRGSFTDAVLQTYNRLPFLTALGNPFPRFWSNSMEFLFKHSPLGFTRLMAPGMRAAIASGDTRAAAQAFSQATLGTTMLGLGYALREGPWAGPRWYQLNIGNNRMLDIRPFAPFSTYAFLAEMIREAQGKPTQMSPADYLTGLVGINRITGSGLVIVDAIRSKDFNKTGQILKSFAGEWAGSFATPFQTAQDISGDIQGQFGQRERALRSSREDPLTGPFRKNIPGLSQTLPAQPSAYEPSPVVPPIGRGVMRQATGISIRDYTPLEMAAEQLGIHFQDVSPKTGDPKTDRLVLEKMGLLSQKIGPGLLNALKSFPDPEEGKAVFLQFIGEIKKAATEQVMAENPQFAMDRTAKGQRGLRRILFERKLQEANAQ